MQNMSVSVPSPFSSPIAIVFCADSQYDRYLSVALQSLLENSSPAREYHCIIFDCGMSEKNFALLQRQCAPYKNVTLKRENITAHLQKHKQAFQTKYYWSAATYGRFFIPELCPHYERVIYADIDMIFNRDIAGCAAIDLQDQYIAAVPDPEFAYNRSIKPKTKRYMEEILGLSENDSYVSAGLMVFNIPLWIKENIAQKAINFLAAHNLDILDQDAVNAVCKGRIYYLDAGFNCLSMNQKGKTLYNRQNPASPLWENWKQAYDSENCVFHYNAYVKPWHDAHSDKAALWWRYARKVENYEALLQDCAADKAQRHHAEQIVLICYSLFGLPIFRIKQQKNRRRYYLFGMKIGKMRDEAAQQAGAAKPPRSFYLFGIKFCCRTMRAIP